MPKQTSIQLTEATQRQVSELQASGYGSFTDIVRLAVDRMYQKEITIMNPEFSTYMDAIAAGYQTVNRRTDKDISGDGYFGYEFERDGKQTVSVYFSKELNKLGQPGCYRPMYPPSK